jgi:uncharacterized membrane protein
MDRKLTCIITGKEFPPEELVPFSALDRNMQEFVKSRFMIPDNESYIGQDQILNLKKDYLNKLLSDEFGELDELEHAVINSISHNKLLSEKIEDTMDDRLTFGDRVADKIASFGGSWTFIIAFFAFILAWISINIFILVTKPFDPYPFILLNLLLSCLAAIQAPIIMMSQNRQEAKDRIRSEHDYKINLKAELEIQLLHKKIDHMIIHQSKRLLEIQGIQTEMMNAIWQKLGRTNGNGDQNPG